MSDRPRSVLPYLHCASLSTPRWLDGGRSLAFLSNLGGNWEVYRVAVPASGGEPLWPDRLTFFGERVGDLRPTPAAAALVAVDRGGDERWRLFEVSALGARELDPGEGPMRHLAEPGPDGDTFAFSSNRRSPTAFDVYVGRRTTGEVRPVWVRDALLYPVAFSPDGGRLLVRESAPSRDQRLWLVDLRAGGEAEPRLLAAGPEGEVSRFATAVWAPDGRTVFAATDAGREYAAAVAVDVADGAVRTLYAPEADVEEVALSPDGRTLALVENAGGRGVVKALDLASGRVHTWVEGEGVAQGLAWSPEGGRLAFVWDRPDRGVDAYVVEAASGPRPVTRMACGGLDRDAFVAPEEVRVRARDGLVVPAWLYRPPAASPPYAGVWIVHGGPESQSRYAFDPLAQFLVASGLAVVKPNVRGSTGYGRAYEHADDVRRRLDSVDDLADLAADLVGRGILDPARQAVMGGSYGGYMTLATLARHPHLWCAGVDIVGIANLVTFLERTSPWRRPVREAEYGSLERDRDFLVEASPLTHADRIRAPLLVVHGARDPRVPVEEAEQIVALLRARGRPVEYLRYEDEGHGLTKIGNRIDAYERIAAFLLDHTGMA